MWKKLSYLIFCAVLVMLLFGCGGSGGGGSDGGSGSLSMDIVDAKPMIPDDPTELWLYFDGVYAHSPGGWVSLELPETPFRINLLAYNNDHTAQIVTPSRVSAGKITQIRFEISRAEMVVNGSVQKIDLDVPSGTLKTDVPVDQEVIPDGTIHLTSHFDLSKSIVATGSGEYMIKPVIHIFDEVQEGATICGSIGATTFVGDPPKDVVVSVIRETNGETYTQVKVTKESDTEPTDFCIYWMVPNETYLVEVDVDRDGVTDFTPRTVDGTDLEPGEVADIGTF